MLLGNIVGTDVKGTAKLGNAGDGVAIDGNATNNIVGGTTAGSRNLISGNGVNGVEIIGTGSSSGNLVQANFIGTDVTGKVNLGNSKDGVLIDNSASFNTIGGSVSADGNVV